MMRQVERYDLGAKQMGVMNTREFNTIIKNGAVITKQSSEIERLVSEFEWYEAVSDKTCLNKYLPKIMDVSIREDYAYIDMEYILGSTIGEMILRREDYVRVIDKTVRMMHILHEQHCQIVFDEHVAAMKNRYISMTIDRLNSLKNNGNISKLFDERTIVNGVRVCSINECVKQLPMLVKELLIDTAEPFTLVHGDLHFDNIMISEITSNPIMIDPRGDFGGCGLYGDYRYDIAKLFHSTHGRYIDLSRDKFSHSIIGDEIYYTTNNSKLLDDVHDELLKQLRLDEVQLHAIELIEAIIMLSIGSMHKENPDRQLILTIRGLELITPFIKERYDRN